MKRLVKGSLAILAVVLSASLMTGCAGKDGAAGPVGKDGMDASSTCRQCHATDQKIVSKEQQWERTKHSNGYSFEAEYGERPTCQPCHNGLNAVKYFVGDSAAQAQIKSGILDTTTLYNATNVNCRVCHQIHTNYDTTDLALRYSKPVVSRRLPGYTYPDGGKGNICILCHDYRDLPAMSATGAIVNDSVWINSVRFGAHVATQSGMFFGKGGYEDPDYAANKQSGNHSAIITNTCVACHVGEGNGKSHSFTPEVATCNASACHGGKPMRRAAYVVKDPTGLAVGSHKTFGDDTTWYHTGDSSSTEVQRLINEARDSLVAKNLVKLDGEDHYYGHSGVAYSSLAWTRIGTILTVTSPKHSLVVGQNIKITAIDSAGTVDTAAVRRNVAYAVASVVDANTFTVTCLDAGKSSGKLTYIIQVTRQWAGLLQNWRFVDYDLSRGVHNAKYVKFLLVSSLKGIGVTRSTLTFD